MKRSSIVVAGMLARTSPAVYRNCAQRGSRVSAGWKLPRSSDPFGRVHWSGRIGHSSILYPKQQTLRLLRVRRELRGLPR